MVDIVPDYLQMILLPPSIRFLHQKNVYTYGIVHAYWGHPTPLQTIAQYESVIFIGITAYTYLHYVQAEFQQIPPGCSRLPGAKLYTLFHLAHRYYNLKKVMLIHPHIRRHSFFNNAVWIKLNSWLQLNVASCNLGVGVLGRDHIVQFDVVW